MLKNSLSISSDLEIYSSYLQRLQNNWLGKQIWQSMVLLVLIRANETRILLDGLSLEA